MKTGKVLVAPFLLLVAACASDDGRSDDLGVAEQASELGMTEEVTAAPSISEVVAANKQADESLNLILRESVGPGHVIEFYEPTPGTVVVSEVGIVPVPPLKLPSGADALETYRLATGKEAVPVALLDAVGRADGDAVTRSGDTEARTPVVATAEGGASEKTPELEELPVVRAAGSCDAVWFSTEHCSMGGDWQWSVLDWWDGRHVDCRGGDDETRAVVCADIGNIKARYDTDDPGLGGSWDVYQGTWRRWSAWTNLRCVGVYPFRDCWYPDFDDIDHWIEEAIGDRFHFCGMCNDRD